jgi:hypothetical protein
MNSKPAWLLALALVCPSAATAQVKPLSTAVIKSSTGMCLKGKTCHKGQAGVWVPQTKIAILAVSLAEQTDIDVYVDIEVSTRPQMYMCAGNDSNGCIARAKYSGPGPVQLRRDLGQHLPRLEHHHTFQAFPAGYGIIVDKGTPIYVHLDARNDSLIDVVGRPGRVALRTNSAARHAERGARRSRTWRCSRSRPPDLGALTALGMEEARFVQVAQRVLGRHGERAAERRIDLDRDALLDEREHARGRTR